MRVVEADEIIFPSSLGEASIPRSGGSVSLDDLPLDELRLKIEALVSQGKLNQLVPTQKTMPILILGVVGGALGAHFLKSTLGLGVAALAGFWAYNEITTPQGPRPKPQMPASMTPLPGPAKTINLP